MANQDHISLPTLALISLLIPLLHSSPFAEAINGEIKTNTFITSTCNKTPYPQLCISSLESDPRSATTADLPGVSRIAVNVLAGKVKDALAVANFLVQNQKDYESWANAAACRMNMELGVSTMAEKGVPAAKRGDFQAVYDAVNLLRSNGTYCTEVFPDMNDKYTVPLIQLADDTNAILHLLF